MRKFSLSDLIDCFYFYLIPVPAPITLQFMTKGYLQAEVDKIRIVDKFTTMLDGEYLKKKLEAQQAPSQGTRLAAQKHPARKASEKAPKKRKRVAQLDVPEDEEVWIGRGMAIAESFNLPDMNTLLKVNKYVFSNGQWEIFPTPKNGGCLFSAIRRGLESPEEFRNSHLRYMIVLFIRKHADFMFSILDEHVAGNYGLERMDPAVYQAAKEEGSLTPAQIEAQNTPGPFSFIGYIEALLEDTFWGDHGVLLTVSMMWQVAITVLTAEDFGENRIRHSRRLTKADFLLIYCGDSHYLGACKYFFSSFSYANITAMARRSFGEW